MHVHRKPGCRFRRALGGVQWAEQRFLEGGRQISFNLVLLSHAALEHLVSYLIQTCWSKRLWPNEAANLLTLIGTFALTLSCGVSFAARARSARAANDTTRAQINNISEKSHVIIIIINKQGQMISRMRVLIYKLSE